MPRQPELSLNDALAELLRGMMPTCTVVAENTKVLVDHPNQRPDILVRSPGRSPVVVEAEYEPAHTVEKDAEARLEQKVKGEHRKIEAVIALRYPTKLKSQYEVREALRETQLSYHVLREKEAGGRFPDSGLLRGSVEDLADLIQLVSVPEREIEKAVGAFKEGIDDAAAMLEGQKASTRKIADLLQLENEDQTHRMACAIIGNAMVFHERISGIDPSLNIPPLNQLQGLSAQADILRVWTHILDINYFPIFNVAMRMLEELNARTAEKLLTRLSDMAQQIEASGATPAHDLTGRIFQSLIADRKYLAAFYTRPESATLLARLAVAKLQGTNWSSQASIGNLRIADFACGTGALLAAVYDQIAVRHERAKGDVKTLHKVLMEDVLYGYDVLPSAAHITASTLSGIQPTVSYGQSRTYLVPYGREASGRVAIGSLELLNKDALLQRPLSQIFSRHEPARRIRGKGKEIIEDIGEFPDESFDMVIMNPPFTKAGSDWEGESRSDDTIKQFRGLGTSPETQKEMAARQKEFAKGTCAHGYAGLGSYFAALADRKLKKGGVLALVLPLSSASGTSWEKFRKLYADHYDELEVLSIAQSKDVCFSSDTDMAEALIIARKREQNGAGAPEQKINFISIKERPKKFEHASETAKRILAARNTRKLGDGPFGGTPLNVGEDLVGEMLTAHAPQVGEAWACVRIKDFSLAQTAYALSRSKLWLPGAANAEDLSTAPLNLVGERGIYSVNIVGAPPAPFEKMGPSPTATYPCLWSHNAQEEKRMVCRPDCQVRAIQGREDRASDVWKTASRCHLNRDFTFGSQPLAVAFTERKTLGGRAWPNIQFQDEKLDYAFTVWGNSTLGLLLYWWHANRQQPGRGIITISNVKNLPILNLRALSAEQLKTAQQIFDDFSQREFQPAYIADADPVRALLDKRVVCDLLGFGNTIYQGVRELAGKWCAEPSVHGGKKRPAGAKLVI